jgi:hypothetical protein
MLAIPCLLLLFFSSNSLSEDSITVIEHSVKPVAAVSAGKYIETEWEVKLCNESENPVTCVITILFNDENDETLKKTSKKIELKAHEVNTCSDTLLLRSSIVSQIVSSGISVTIE